MMWKAANLLLLPIGDCRELCIVDVEVPEYTNNRYLLETLEFMDKKFKEGVDVVVFSLDLWFDSLSVTRQRDKAISRKEVMKRSDQESIKKTN